MSSIYKLLQKLEKETLITRKDEISLKTSMKTTGLKTTSALEGAATRMVLAAFKAVSTCTCFALDRVAETSRPRHNYAN